MNSESFVGKKLRFGKYNWTIINWSSNGCMLICDVFDGNHFFQAWDRTYRIDFGEDASWPKCELHDWLNNDFLKSSFSDEEAACIVNEACHINGFNTDQVGVFILEKSELTKNTHIFIDNCWSLDTEAYYYGEDEVTNEKYVQPVIWIDFTMVDALIPGWKALAEVLAWSSGRDFNVPIPVGFYQTLNDNYNLAADQLLRSIESASENARRYYYESIYETLYCMAENDDAVSINKVFKLCPDLEPEGFYSYDQMLPLGVAIENEAYNAINALVDNGCSIDCATMAEESTIRMACRLCNPDRMVLFLIEKGLDVEFLDILEIWIWSDNPELAKKVVSIIAPTNIQQYIKDAKENFSLPLVLDHSQKELLYCQSSCPGDIIIPTTVEVISNSAFSGCRHITSVYVPDSVTQIGQYCFHGCDSLIKLRLPFAIEANSFYGCDSLKSVVSKQQFPKNIRRRTRRAIPDLVFLTEEKT